MKAYKIELLIIDFENMGGNEIVDVIENANYPNDCISPCVKDIKCVDIGEWSDDHPLNSSKTSDKEYKRLFKD